MRQNRPSRRFARERPRTRDVGFRQARRERVAALPRFGRFFHALLEYRHLRPVFFNDLTRRYMPYYLVRALAANGDIPKDSPFNLPHAVTQ